MSEARNVTVRIQGVMKPPRPRGMTCQQQLEQIKRVIEAGSMTTAEMAERARRLGQGATRA